MGSRNRAHHGGIGGRLAGIVAVALGCAALASPGVFAAPGDAPELFHLEDYGPGAYWPSVMSPDGRIVTALVWPQFASRYYVRWVDGVAERLFVDGSSLPDSGLDGMTPDGAAIVGKIQGPWSTEAFLWHDGLTRLGFLDTSTPYYASEARDITADGRRIVGFSGVVVRSPVQWIDGAIEALATPGVSAEAYFVSDTGHRIVGRGLLPTGNPLIVWDDGVYRDVGDPPGGGIWVDPRAMTADGRLVVGSGEFEDGRRAFLWDGAAFHSLGQLPEGDVSSTATGVAADGGVVVGYAIQDAGDYCQDECPQHRVPFIWTPATGMRSLHEYLLYACGYDIHRWSLGDPILAENGRFVAFSASGPGRRYGVSVAEVGELCDPDYEVPPNPLEPGDYLVVNYLNEALVRVDRETGAQAYVSQGAALRYARNLVQTPEGDEVLVLVGGAAGAVVAVDLESGAQRVLARLASSAPTLAMTPDGRLFTTERLRTPYPGRARIVEIDRNSGALREVEMEPGLTTTGPLVSDSAGRLYYRGWYEGEDVVLRIDPDTGAHEPLFVGDLGGSNNMTITRDDRLVLVDGSVIRILDIASGERSVVDLDLESASLPFLSARATSIDSKGRLLAPDYYLFGLNAVHLDTGEIDDLGSGLLLDEPFHAIELRAACDDGFDNDGDGWADYPEDPGCADPHDDTEENLEIPISIHVAIPPRQGEPGKSPAGTASVVVWGSGEFDVRTIDPTSVVFGPGRAYPLHAGGPRLDWNRDGYMDSRFLFRTADAELDPGADVACLRGATDDGRGFAGCAPLSWWGCGIGYEIALVLLTVRWVRRALDGRRLGRRPVRRVAHESRR